MKRYLLYGVPLLAALFILSWKAAWNEDADITNIAKVYAKYALDEKQNVLADTNLIGIWKMAEDSDPHNYFVIERRDPTIYVYTYMNRGGSNRIYENCGAFMSEVEGTKFINARYWDWDAKSGGYFFLKVIEIKNRGFDMTLALVADTTLKSITNPKDVRERITKNLNNADYYKKPVHFHKILPLMYCK